MREQSVNDRRRAGHPEQRGRTEASRPQPQPKKKKPRRFYDYSLLFTIIFLTVFGLVMIYSSSSYNAQVLGQGPAYYMKRQGYIALAGFAAMLVISKMDYHFLRNLPFRPSWYPISVCFW